jgi:hypothetical protein|uniref:Uncharacterized protein n=1 Tax=Picea glauca TaxID=3330 RepID=A0A101LYM6_PICGL|nr:hypothetical protein ABT39_MTgene5941 [Picea glauca]
MLVDDAVSISWKCSAEEGAVAPIDEKEESLGTPFFLSYLFNRQRVLDKEIRWVPLGYTPSLSIDI